MFVPREWLMEKHMTRRVQQNLLLMAIDTALLLFSMFLALFVSNVPHTLIATLWLYVFLFTLLHIIVLFLAGFYSIRLVDSSLDLITLGGIPMMVLSGVAVVLLLVVTRDFSFVFKTYIPFSAFSLLLVLGYRVFYRIAKTYLVSPRQGKGNPKAIIYGAGEIGMQLARQYYRNRLGFSIAGFIDDNPVKLSMIVGGIRVLGSIDTLPAIIRSVDADLLIIAITDLKKEKIREAMDIAGRFGVEVKIIPSMFEMEESKTTVSDIRAIQVEDLIGRSPVVLDKQPVKHMVSGKSVLVTGAGGSIGSEICRQLLEYGTDRLYLLDIDETELHDLSLRLHHYRQEFSEKIIPIVCDVRDASKVETLFKKLSFDIVFHAAAYKHVPMMEYYPEEAIKTNIVGTYNILSNAVSSGVERCIIISTDKAVNPTNVMGATKRVAEQIASTLSCEATQIISVRFGNVLGSRGSMLPLFMEQLKNGLPITVTDRGIIRYFMTIPEAVSLVFQAGALGKGGEVMVLEMGDPVNIYEFAKKLVTYFGDGRSDVVITGLRPGEKLYEEKLSDADTTIPTDNPKVYKALVTSNLNQEAIREFISSYGQLSQVDLVEELKRMVPEFVRPANTVVGS